MYKNHLTREAVVAIIRLINYGFFSQEVNMTKTRNSLISVGIALLLLIAAAVFVIPQKTASAATVWDGTVASSFAGGDGSETSPYQIANGKQLAYLARQVNGGESYNGKYFELIADIDLGGHEWKPIGTGYDNQNFCGTFDGKGFTISNLKISKGSSGALFFDLRRGTIKNLCLENVDINLTDGARAAAVCVSNVGGTIENCSVISGTIIAERAAGISGKSDNAARYINCYNNATITGGIKAAAGIALGEGKGTIEYCLNTGAVSCDENIHAYAIGNVADCKLLLL